MEFLVKNEKPGLPISWSLKVHTGAVESSMLINSAYRWNSPLKKDWRKKHIFTKKHIMVYQRWFIPIQNIFPVVVFVLKKLRKNLNFIKISTCRTLMKRSLSTTLLLKVSRGTHWYLTSSFFCATIKKTQKKQKTFNNNNNNSFRNSHLLQFWLFLRVSPEFTNGVWIPAMICEGVEQSVPSNLATELFTSKRRKKTAQVQQWKWRFSWYLGFLWVYMGIYWVLYPADITV